MAEDNMVVSEYIEEPDNEPQGQGLIVPKTEKVSERDIFKLAIWVLLSAAVIYISAAAARIFLDNAGVKDVWENTKGFTSPIVTLVLGLYFGNKTKSLN